ncbi:DNA-binding response OmpR family regulator [Tumebacillus sp. BK434]|uniref:response regulator transcription factor n=1 Tax=Tumebacillus sp. BK434 TaxID=2512169 RepID=UPI001050BFC7|nr:response regulator transcription factor [Tumebacillus sp. BK434]TCP57933.1 DNA-binding response OmpR family regulator [Tumebacillus sp. BK434]
MRIAILVADDDPHLRTLVGFYLQKEGYRVLQAEDGTAASRLLEEERVHVAIVDVMMPGKDGLELCREIRDHYDIPVILLTAKGAAEDKERGFLSGTDDYVVKPFEPRELVLRIKALLRRYQLAADDAVAIGGTVIDRGRFEVRIGEREVLLPRREFELLFQLASAPDRVFTRDQLLDSVWGAGYQGDARTIDVHIKRLRERFAGQQQDFVITTVRGIGYKLEVTAS